MNATPTAAAAGKIDVGGDLTVNRLGFGAMRITGSGIWGDPPDRDRAIQALRRAVALDVNFIDTADSYGPEVSERLIAEALYPYPEELVIATKGGLVRPGPGRWVPDGRPEHLRQACEGSLRRLRLDRIDLYQFHRPDPRVPIAESIGALAELKDEGKIRHIGVSNVTEDQFREAEQVTAIVSVQNRYNVVDRSSEPMLGLCDLEMVVFIPWAPIEETGTIPALMAAARRRGVTERQVALAWLLTRSPQVLPIPVRENIERIVSCRDWFETVVAVNLVFEPMVGRLMKTELLARNAPRHGDAVTPLVLASANADIERHRAATAELVRLVLADPSHGDGNRVVLAGWLDTWTAGSIRAAVELVTRQGVRPRNVYFDAFVPTG